MNLLFRQNLDLVSPSWGFMVFDLLHRHADTQATLTNHSFFVPDHNSKVQFLKVFRKEELLFPDVVSY